MEEQLEYWKAELSDLQGLALPLDRPRPQVLSNRGAKLTLIIDPTKAALFRETLKSISSNLSPFTGCLALFMVMLSRYMGKDGFAVGVAMANRGHEGMKAMIGYFANEVAILADLGANSTFREVVLKINEKVLNGMRNSATPFHHVADAIGTVRDSSRQAVFQAMFA